MQIIGKQTMLSTLILHIHPKQGLGWVHPTRGKPGFGFKQPIWINSNKKMIIVKRQVVHQSNTWAHSECYIYFHTDRIQYNSVSKSMKMKALCLDQNAWVYAFMI